jgi:hypothetical protein
MKVQQRYNDLIEPRGSSSKGFIHTYESERERETCKRDFSMPLKAKGRAG